MFYWAAGASSLRQGASGFRWSTGKVLAERRLGSALAEARVLDLRKRLRVQLELLVLYEATGKVF